MTVLEERIPALGRLVRRFSRGDQSVGSQPAPEATPEPTAHQLAVQALVAQYGVCCQLAESTMTWIRERVEEARENGGLAYPGDRVMDTPEYRLFDEVMPHGAVRAEPGSAHALIQAAVLDPTRGEAGLHHDQVDTRCSVELHFQVLGHGDQPVGNYWD